MKKNILQVRGSEAAAAADYSVAEFSALPRLILVHGRWNASRAAKWENTLI